MKKIFLIAIFVVMINSLSFAGQLIQGTTGINYMQDDGTFAVNKWIQIDIDGNGANESYYFDANGLLLTNTITPDGYKVNEKGQWVNNGIPVGAINNVKPVQKNIESSSVNKNSEMVWYVDTGKKFHKNKNCSKMKNPKQITRKEAERNGLEPCQKSKCYGKYF